MTKDEMELITCLLLKCNDSLVLFDTSTDDKKILIVAQDELTLVRYVIASPVMSDEQREFAQSELDYLLENDRSVSPVQQTPFEEDDRVLYCAPNFGRVVNPDPFTPAHLEEFSTGEAEAKPE